MKKIIQTLSRIAFYPLPLRVLFFKTLLKFNKWLPYSMRLEFDAVARPNYGFCIYNAAQLAKSLGIKRISIIEFGVAGGNGLVNLEQHAEEISKALDIEFEIYGFDMGSGLPKPLGFRDMPYMWAEGFYKMDLDLLKNRLKFSKLIIGNVKETCTTFFEEYGPAPIGCAMFDLDYYSSTIDAFNIFHADENNYLPRIYCYFDDIASNGLRAMNNHVGVLRAIEEFNQTNSSKKIARIEGFSTSRKIKSTWNNHIFVLHDFEHAEYETFIGNSHQSLDLV
jgi:hypothetical protein